MRNDGGPAFPLNTPKTHEEYSDSGYDGCDFTMGMTLRDYFAAKAMQGILASPRAPSEAIDNGSAVTDTMIARLAYAVAEAMLKARESGDA